MLHLNSRSMIFEPTPIELPLIRFKYCDSLKMSVGQDMTSRQIISRVASPDKKNKCSEILQNIFLK